MTFVLLARWWLAAVLVSLTASAGVLSPWLNYPVAVNFDFAYRGQAYHVSYVTLMRMRLCRDFFECIVKWLPGRSVESVVLRDGSLVVLIPPLPWLWKKDFDTVRGRAAWIWLDKPSAPTEIVLGNRLEKPSKSQSDPFPTLIVDTTIERVSQFYRVKAFISDLSSDNADPILASSIFKVFNFNRDGRLFAEIEATPVVFEGSWIRHSSDWVDIDGGCRILFSTPQNVNEVNKGTVADWQQTRSLLRSLSKEGDIWSFDEEPGPDRGKPRVTYDTGTNAHVAGGVPIPDLVRPALDQVHNIKHDGKICRIPDWPRGSFNAVVDFGDDQIFFVNTSLSWVIIRE